MKLEYAPNVAPRTIERMEEAARAVGIPLADLELLGQDQAAATDFVESVMAGRHSEYLDGVDWATLRTLLHGRTTAPPDKPQEAAAA